MNVWAVNTNTLQMHSYTHSHSQIFVYVWIQYFHYITIEMNELGLKRTANTREEKEKDEIKATLWTKKKSPFLNPTK